MNRREWEQSLLPCSEPFGYWFAGFVDGEGCFSIAKAPKGCYRVELRIKLRADDAPILEQIAAELGMGSVYTGEHSTAGINGKPWAMWAVRRRQDLIKLTEVFDAFPLRTKKARDYAIWREAAIEWAIGSQPMNWTPIEQAFHALRAVREFVPAPSLPPPSPTHIVRDFFGRTGERSTTESSGFHREGRRHG